MKLKDYIKKNLIYSKPPTKKSKVTVLNFIRPLFDYSKLSYEKNINGNFSFTELPADAQLHDLASLSTIDSKLLDPEQLGIDAIKEQQAANLKHSSDKCAIIPEDQAHTMLAGVSFIFHFRMHIFFPIRNILTHSNART